MPQHAKGIRIWLRPARGTRQAVWIIKDGAKRVSTGCGKGERGAAERALAQYLAEKYTPARDRNRRASEIPIEDAINLYAADIGPTVRRPKELASRLGALLEFWMGKSLSDVTAANCRAFIEARGQSSGRRALEDLRAALRHFAREGYAENVPLVTLPPRTPPRQRFLTRSEAARLIWAAWRYREAQKGVLTERRPRQHVARFVLVGLYTGTRAGAICGASFTPAIGRGYVDLEAGVFYRRVLGDRETKKRQPAIGLSPRLLAHMRRWARFQSSVVEFDRAPVKSVRKAFAAAAREAGLEGVSPHVLRHSAASLAMQGGANVYAAADYLGMTVETMERVYGHLRPGHHAGVTRAIEGKGR